MLSLQDFSKKTTDLISVMIMVSFSFYLFFGKIW